MRKQGFPRFLEMSERGRRVADSSNSQLTREGVNVVEDSPLDKTREYDAYKTP